MALNSLQEKLAKLYASRLSPFFLPRCGDSSSTKTCFLLHFGVHVHVNEYLCMYQYVCSKDTYFKLRGIKSETNDLFS